MSVGTGVREGIGVSVAGGVSVASGVQVGVREGGGGKGVNVGCRAKSSCESCPRSMNRLKSAVKHAVRPMSMPMMARLPLIDLADGRALALVGCFAAIVWVGRP